MGICSVAAQRDTFRRLLKVLFGLPFGEELISLPDSGKIKEVMDTKIAAARNRKGE